MARLVDTDLKLTKAATAMGIADQELRCVLGIPRQGSLSICIEEAVAAVRDETPGSHEWRAAIKQALSFFLEESE